MFLKVINYSKKLFNFKIFNYLRLISIILIFNLAFGSKVLLAGLGGVGLSLLSAVKLRGAGQVDVFDSSEAKVRFIKNYRGVNFSSRFDFGERYNHIFDTTGSIPYAKGL